MHAAVPDAAAPDATPECADPPCDWVVAEFPLENRDVDVLFVIDNSGSMAEEQASLVNNFQRMVTILDNVEGGMPNLHVGVVSADVGAGPFNISGCTGNGDNGILQSAPTSEGCSAPEGAFISDISDGAGDKKGRATSGREIFANTWFCRHTPPLASRRRPLTA